MADHSIKLILTRQQRRDLDKLAKAAGLQTGPWARSTLLRLVPVAETSQPRSGAILRPLWLCPVCHVSGNPAQHTCAEPTTTSREAVSASSPVVDGPVRTEGTPRHGYVSGPVTVVENQVRPTGASGVGQKLIASFDPDQ